METFEKKNGAWARSEAQPDNLIDFINSKISTDHDAFYAISPVYSTQLDPAVPGVVYAGMGRGVYRFTPGSGWALLKGVWNDSTVYNIEVSKATGTLFLSSCNGVYAGKVDQISGAEIPDAQVKMARTKSNSFVNQSSGKVSPTYLRTFDVEQRKGHPNDRVAGSASGVYISRDSGVTWMRVTGGELSDKNQRGVYTEFRSVVWLSDGDVVASGEDGTYRFTP